MAVTLGIYYLLPWLRWDRGPYLPDQARAARPPARRFYFFFLEIWPQEFYYVTGLLVLAALGLFLVTSIAGRVWCGYTCPQTVWTDLMIAVERFWQGDRNARLSLDKAPLVVRDALAESGHASLAGCSLPWPRAAPGSSILPTRRHSRASFCTFQAPIAAYLFVGLFTATTYVLGGIAREQVCTYMCPWPRIQGAMFDRDLLLVSYRDLARRAPRAP